MGPHLSGPGLSESTPTGPESPPPLIDLREVKSALKNIPDAGERSAPVLEFAHELIEAAEAHELTGPVGDYDTVPPGRR